MARSSSSHDISFDTDLGLARIRWDGPHVTLSLGDVKSSAVDTSGPTYLELEYMQHMGAVMFLLWSPQNRFRVPHVGGAACAFVYAWSSSRPSSRRVAVEIDRLLAGQVCKYFPVPGAPQVKIHIDDGHAVFDGAREGSFDVIVRDVSASGVTSDHLCIVEYAGRARRVLTVSGVYLINRAHGDPANARRDVAVLREVSPFVASIQDPEVGRGGWRGNVVILASTANVVDVDQTDRALRTLVPPARITRPTDLTRWIVGTRALTDSLVGYPQVG